MAARCRTAIGTADSTPACTAFRCIPISIGPALLTGRAETDRRTRSETSASDLVANHPVKPRGHAQQRAAQTDQQHGYDHPVISSVPKEAAHSSRTGAARECGSWFDAMADRRAR